MCITCIALHGSCGYEEEDACVSHVLHYLAHAATSLHRLQVPKVPLQAVRALERSSRRPKRRLLVIWLAPLPAPAPRPAPPPHIGTCV